MQALTQPTEPLLSVRSLSAGYGQSEVLHDLSFAVEPGEIVAILGLNGMGKTTLMKTLMGLVEARGGAVRFNGEDTTTALPHARVASGVAYVPQGRMVFPRLTVEENVMTGLGDAPREGIDELFRLFPVLGEMRRRRGGNLSGGQQQQLVIARALASRPRLLLLDEPTEGIQPSIIKELSVTLRRIRDERGLSIVVSEQVQSFALAVADRVMVMERGRIAYSSPPEGVDEAVVAQLLAI